MKKLLLAGAVGSMLLMGCKKDGEGEGSSTDGGTTAVETTVAEDKENIHAAMDEIVNCLSNMKNGAMMNSIVAFTGLSEGEALKEDFIESILTNMDGAIDTIEVPTGDKFYFSYFTGTWSYQKSDSSWTRSSSPSDKIVLEMPSDDAATTNNVVCTLQDYSDKKYELDGEEIYLPNSFSFSITKDGDKIGGIELNDLAFEQSGDIVIPINIDGSVYLNPFTFTVDGERTSSTQFQASINIEDGSGCDYSMSAKLDVAHDDYVNLNEEDIKSLQGSVGHNSLKVNYFIDIEKLVLLGDAAGEDGLTEAEINENIDLDVLIKDSKIGNLVLKEGTDTDVEVHIEYKDGSMENTDVYYEPFIEDVEALFDDLTGPWTDEEAI